MIATATPPIFGRLEALADPVRARALLVLERHECSVSELCGVLQLPQSTVSRHLRILSDAGLVVSRAEGTTRRYRMTRSAMPPDGTRVWDALRPEVATTRAADNDERRLKSVLNRRRARSREFFSGAAAEWDRMRAELFGQRSDLFAALALLDDRLEIGDLGCGTGTLAESLAPFVRRVVAVDASPAMLGAARQALAPHANVEVREGDLESLPIADASLDAALLVLVLPYLPDPGAAVHEAARTLRPNGRLVIVDMMPHDRIEYGATMGHLWTGFAELEVRKWMEEAGLRPMRYSPLPVNDEAKGPPLFAAAAVKRGSN